MSGLLNACISIHFDENCHPFLFLTDYLIRSLNYLEALDANHNIAVWPRKPVVKSGEVAVHHPASQPRQTQVSWIYRGQPMTPPAEDRLDEARAFELLDRQGLVKITISSAGTMVTWSVFAANWASLFFAMEWLHTYPPPYKLRYYLAGWFMESFDSALTARNRLDVIVGKSDIHLTRRTFVQEANPNRPDIPPLLKSALDLGHAQSDFSVDCVLDNDTGIFSVDRVGKKSEIAKLWGISPVSYPCTNGLSYDRIVSEAYLKVMAKDEPRYDHVCAAMVMPDRNVIWYDYQRVILPAGFIGDKRGVTVLSKRAPVDINVI